MCSCWSALIAYCFLLLPFRPPLPHTSPCLVFDAVLYNQSFALITTLLRRTICSHLRGVGRDPADHLIFIGDTLPKSVYLSSIINAHHRRHPEAVVPQTPFLKRSKVRRWQDELIRVDENFGEIIIKSRQTEAMFCRGDVFNTLMNVCSCFSDWWYFFFYLLMSRTVTMTYIFSRSVVFLCAAIGHHMDQSVDPVNKKAKLFFKNAFENNWKEGVCLYTHLW